MIAFDAALVFAVRHWNGEDVSGSCSVVAYPCSIRLYETLRREFEFGKVGDPEDGKREFHDENAELRR